MKETINKVKRKPTERGKVFTNHKSDKRSDSNILVKSRIYNSKYTKNSYNSAFQKTRSN